MNSCKESVLVIHTPRRIDLLTLTNGAADFLGQVSLPAGTYTQIRLVLTEQGNSVVLEGGEERKLKTPSAQQSGLKLHTHFDVPEGQVADVTLDFDACKSIVKAGNSGQWLLKPVISVIPVFYPAGQTIQGQVTEAALIDDLVVSVQQGGATLRSTTPDTTGKFVLAPVPVGTYNLVYAAPSRATTVLTGVPAEADATPTLVAPITLPASGTGTVSGQVVVTPVPTDGVDAITRALQTLAGGLVVEVAAGRADVDGLYGFQLAVAQAQSAAYNPTTLTRGRTGPPASVRLERRHILEGAQQWRAVARAGG